MLRFQILYHALKYYKTGAVRPSIRPANTVRPSILPTRLKIPDPTVANDFGGIRRPGGSNRPKFPPRPRPSGQSGDNSEAQSNTNKDLISLIPIDRPSSDKNEINGDNDDPRVLTGGPFIPNFGGGGRPGRPVPDSRKPIDQNTGTGSAVLQKVEYN